MKNAALILKIFIAGRIEASADTGRIPAARCCFCNAAQKRIALQGRSVIARLFRGGACPGDPKA